MEGFNVGFCVICKTEIPLEIRMHPSGIGACHACRDNAAFGANPDNRRREEIGRRMLDLPNAHSVARRKFDWAIDDPLDGHWEGPYLLEALRAAKIGGEG